MLFKLICTRWFFLQLPFQDCQKGVFLMIGCYTIGSEPMLLLLFKHHRCLCGNLYCSLLHLINHILLLLGFPFLFLALLYSLI